MYHCVGCGDKFVDANTPNVASVRAFNSTHALITLPRPTRVHLAHLVQRHSPLCAFDKQEEMVGETMDQVVNEDAFVREFRPAINRILDRVNADHETISEFVTWCDPTKPQAKVTNTLLQELHTKGAILNAVCNGVTHPKGSKGKNRISATVDAPGDDDDGATCSPLKRSGDDSGVFTDAPAPGGKKPKNSVYHVVDPETGACITQPMSKVFILSGSGDTERILIFSTDGFLTWANQLHPDDNVKRNGITGASMRITNPELASIREYQDTLSANRAQIKAARAAKAASTPFVGPDQEQNVTTAPTTYVAASSSSSSSSSSSQEPNAAAVATTTTTSRPIARSVPRHNAGKMKKWREKMTYGYHDAFTVRRLFQELVLLTFNKDDAITLLKGNLFRAVRYAPTELIQILLRPDFEKSVVESILYTQY